MKLFTGISLPEPVLYRVVSSLAPLRPLADIRWSPPSNLHITTRFIGAWPADRVSELTAALRTISSPAFNVELSGLGWFPSAQSPHVFWMGVQGGDALHALAARTDSALTGLGCTREDKAFNPHLTLARTRREAKLQPLRQAIATLAPPAVPPFLVDHFHLYQSEAGVYRRLETFHLVTPDARKIY